MSEDFRFCDSNGVHLSAPEVVREIVGFMMVVPERNYKVIIGTDSEKRQKGADFVTAIVVYRVGNGGRYFFRRIQSTRPFHTLRDRILEEVMMSLDIAKGFLANFRGVDAPKFDFEIHVDVGERGATKVMLQELVGMIRANHFEARTKPDSYAASKVADRHV